MMRIATDARTINTIEALRFRRESLLEHRVNHVELHVSAMELSQDMLVVAPNAAGS
jgi:hypothetical protein